VNICQAYPIEWPILLRIPKGRSCSLAFAPPSPGGAPLYYLHWKLNTSTDGTNEAQPGFIGAGESGSDRHSWAASWVEEVWSQTTHFPNATRGPNIGRTIDRILLRKLKVSEVI
jgi:hypothetical protein